MESEHRAALMAAPVLSDEDGKRLEALTNRNSEQNLLLAAHRIRQALGITAMDEDTLDFWDDGRAVRMPGSVFCLPGALSLLQ